MIYEKVLEKEYWVVDKENVLEIFNDTQKVTEYMNKHKDIKVFEITTKKTIKEVKNENK